jgi:hypothetical protein
MSSWQLSGEVESPPGFRFEERRYFGRVFGVRITNLASNERVGSGTVIGRSSVRRELKSLFKRYEARSK